MSKTKTVLGLTNSAKCAMKDGDFEQAEQYLLQAMRLQPNEYTKRMLQIVRDNKNMTNECNKLTEEITEDITNDSTDNITIIPKDKKRDELLKEMKMNAVFIKQLSSKSITENTPLASENIYDTKTDIKANDTLAIKKISEANKLVVLTDNTILIDESDNLNVPKPVSETSTENEVQDIKDINNEIINTQLNMKNNQEINYIFTEQSIPKSINFMSIKDNSSLVTPLQNENSQKIKISKIHSSDIPKSSEINKIEDIYGLEKQSSETHTIFDLPQPSDINKLIDLSDKVDIPKTKSRKLLENEIQNGEVLINETINPQLKMKTVNSMFKAQTKPKPNPKRKVFYFKGIKKNSSSPPHLHHGHDQEIKISKTQSLFTETKSSEINKIGDLADNTILMIQQNELDTSKVYDKSMENNPEDVNLINSISTIAQDNLINKQTINDNSKTQSGSNAFFLDIAQKPKSQTSTFETEKLENLKDNIIKKQTNSHTLTSILKEYDAQNMEAINEIIILPKDKVYNKQKYNNILTENNNIVCDNSKMISTTHVSKTLNENNSKNFINPEDNLSQQSIYKQELNQEIETELHPKEDLDRSESTFENETEENQHKEMCQNFVLMNERLTSLTNQLKTLESHVKSAQIGEKTSKLTNTEKDYTRNQFNIEIPEYYELKSVVNETTASSNPEKISLVKQWQEKEKNLAKPTKDVIKQTSKTLKRNNSKILHEVKYFNNLIDNISTDCLKQPTKTSKEKLDKETIKVADNIKYIGSNVHTDNLLKQTVHNPEMISDDEAKNHIKINQMDQLTEDVFKKEHNLSKQSNLQETNNFTIPNNSYSDNIPKTKQPLQVEEDDLSKEQSDKSIKIAENALSNGDLDRAELFLKKAERLYPSQRGKDLLNIVLYKKANGEYKSNSQLNANSPKEKSANKNYEEIVFNDSFEFSKNIKDNIDYNSKINEERDAQENCHLQNNIKSTTSDNEVIDDEYNKEQANNCIDYAEEALSKGNTEKAKRLLNKAERLYPTQRAKDLLQQISPDSTGEKNSTPKFIRPNEIIDDDLNKEQAEKCIEYAEQAISEGNFTKAERFLKRSERLYPSQNAKDLLKTILDISNKGFNSNNINRQRESYEIVDDDYNKDNSEKCIENAIEAIAKGNTEEATRLLKKAQRLYPSEHAKELLKQIADTDFGNNSNKTDDNPDPSTSNNNIDSDSNTPKLVSTEDKLQAEKCIEVAQDCLSAKNFAKARRLLMKAERFYPTARAKDLLKQIDLSETLEDSNDKKDSTQTSAESSTSQEPIQNPADETKKRRRGRREVTAKHIEAVQRVNLQSTDLYEILGLPQGAPIATIKSQFRTLRLLLHPDRNPAPGSAQAYMAVTEAFNKIKSTMI